MHGGTIELRGGASSQLEDIVIFRHSRCRVEVVGRDDPGDGVGVGIGSQMLCDRDMARLAVAPRQRFVGDPSQQCLDKPVLAPLRRPRVGVDVEDLLATQCGEHVVDVL